MEPIKIDSIPESYQKQDGILSISHEEESIVWLWAFPYLFPWQYRAEWLFSPVVGNKRWPGDLWGLDNKGNLLISEAKNCRTQLKSDPFGDFVNILKSHDSYVEEFTSDNLRQKWESLKKKEPSLSNRYDESLRGKTGGILPHSNHREHIHRWKDMERIIKERIRSKAYKSRVERWLKKRKNRNNPVPHFFGLLVRDESMRFGLNEKGLQSKHKLCNIVKETNVHLYEAYAERKEENSLVLCIKPEIG